MLYALTVILIVLILIAIYSFVRSGSTGIAAQVFGSIGRLIVFPFTYYFVRKRKNFSKLKSYVKKEAPEEETFTDYGGDSGFGGGVG